MSISSVSEEIIAINSLPPFEPFHFAPFNFHQTDENSQRLSEVIGGSLAALIINSFSRNMYSQTELNRLKGRQAQQIFVCKVAHVLNLFASIFCNLAKQ